MAVAVEAAPLVIRLGGAAGMALELFRQLLTGEGIVTVDEGADTGLASVAVLVEPRPEHWNSAKDAGLPIVIVVSEEADDQEVLRALLAGAEAVLHGDSAPADVVATLEEVGRGGTVLDATQARALVAVARTAASKPPVTLSKREGEILASIAQGDSVKQTARSLGISPKTVENIQSRLFRKLTVRNRAQAVARAHELGML